MHQQLKANKTGHAHELAHARKSNGVYTAQCFKTLNTIYQLLSPFRIFFFWMIQNVLYFFPPFKQVYFKKRKKNSRELGRDQQDMSNTLKMVKSRRFEVCDLRRPKRSAPRRQAIDRESVKERRRKRRMGEKGTGENESNCYDVYSLVRSLL